MHGVYVAWGVRVPPLWDVCCRGGGALHMGMCCMENVAQSCALHRDVCCIEGCCMGG